MTFPKKSEDKFITVMGTPISAGKQIGGKLIVPTGTPVSAGKEMSGSLKERLKRSSRYYKSPLAPKRLCHSPVSSFSSQNTTEDRTAHTCLALDSRITLSCQSSPRRRDIRQTNLKTNSTLADQQSSNGKIYNSTPDLVVSLDNSAVSHVSVCENTCEDRKLLSGNSSLSKSNCVRLKTVDSEISPRCKLDYVTLGKDEVTVAALSARTEDQPVQKSDEITQLKKQKSELLSVIADKEEILRKLKMVKMYRTKNDLQELERLSKKWRSVSQEALQELWQLTPEPKPSLTELVKHFQLDHQLIGFNPEDESFLS